MRALMRFEPLPLSHYPPHTLFPHTRHTHTRTLWEPIVQSFLGPWSDGNLSATVLDMAYWKEMYGWSRGRSLPGVHVSIAKGVLRARVQVDYRMELFKDMLRSVRQMVDLPNVEFVAHLWDHPKVKKLRTQQTPYDPNNHASIPTNSLRSKPCEPFLPNPTRPTPRSRGNNLSPSSHITPTRRTGTCLCLPHGRGTRKPTAFRRRRR